MKNEPTPEPRKEDATPVWVPPKLEEISGKETEAGTYATTFEGGYASNS